MAAGWISIYFIRVYFIFVRLISAPGISIYFYRVYFSSGSIFSEGLVVTSNFGETCCLLNWQIRNPM